MEEIWKDVVGYEGLYQVSNLGMIRSLGHDKKHKGKVLKTSLNTGGYFFVRLTKENTKKLFLVHRLVALAFLPKQESKDFIDHINTIKTDNRVENLRWCTRSENMNNPLTLEIMRKRALGNKRMLGKHLSEETKEKISKSKTGVKRPHFWESISEEKRLKIKKAAYEANRVKVDQYTTDGKFIKTWESIKLATISIGASQSGIYNCCNGFSKTCMGYLWKHHIEKN